MDAIGNIKVAIPTFPTQTSQAALPLPKPASSEAPVLPQKAEEGFDVQAAEQRRYEAIQKMAQGVANVFIVSDRTFSLFKDSTGQYITRFTSLRDGRVTYIPEPELMKMSSSNAAASAGILV